MSVDFFDCDVCRESVCMCGYYVSCDCGRKWCSDECAEEDGWINEEENEDSDVYRSCKYCREEDFEDSELLKYALKGLEVTRSELIDMYKLEKE